MNAGHPIFRIVLRLASFIAFILFVASVRIVQEGEREFEQSTSALVEKNPDEAILHARRAAQWYLPGLPHVRSAYQRLRAIGIAAESVGENEHALLAWNSIHTACHSTRWIVVPHETFLVEADAAIARLSALADRPANTRHDPNAMFERRELFHLRHDESPRLPWLIVLLMSLGGMVVAAWVSAHDLERNQRFSWKSKWGTLAVIAFTFTYFIAVWRA